MSENTPIIKPKRDCYDAYQEAMSAFIFKNPYYYYWVGTTEYKEKKQVPQDGPQAFNISTMKPDFHNANYTLNVDSDVFPRMDLPGRMFALARNVLNAVYLHGNSDYAQHKLWPLSAELAVTTKLMANGMKMPEHPDHANEPGFVTPEFAADMFEQIWSEYESITGKPRPSTISKPVQPPVGTKPAEHYFKWALDNAPPGMDGGSSGQPSPEMQELIEKLLERAAQDFEQMTSEEKQMAEIMAAEAAQEANNHAGAPPGFLAGDIENLLKALKPKIKWQDKLRNFMGQLGRMEIKPSHARENKYKQVPRISLKPNKKILVAIDTSGSVSDTLLSQFLAELEGVAQHTDVDVMFVDYGVQEVKPFKKASDGQYKVKGRGGTDMRQIFTWCHNNNYRADGIIVQTDGYTPFPTREDRRGVRTLWLVSEKGITVPAEAGETVHFDNTIH